jgi:hypothetical protein
MRNPVSAAASGQGSAAAQASAISGPNRVILVIQRTPGERMPAWWHSRGALSSGGGLRAAAK